MQVGRLLAGKWSIRSPRKLMVPSVRSSMPTRRRISVDLPLPDGPTMVRNSPSAMSSVMRSSAVNRPKRLVTFSIRRKVLPAMLKFPLIEMSPAGTMLPPEIFASGSAAASLDVDRQEFVVGRHFVELDAARQFFRKRIDLHGVQLVLVEQLHHLRITHLGNRVERATAGGDQCRNLGLLNEFKEILGEGRKVRIVHRRSDFHPHDASLAVDGAGFRGYGPDLQLPVVASARATEHAAGEVAIDLAGDQRRIHGHQIV